MGGIVAPGCCSGLKALDDAIKTNEDVWTACYCIKDGAAKIPSLNNDRLNELPGICGTTNPIKLSPSLDCSKVSLTSRAYHVDLGMKVHRWIGLI
ncbi:hypothetical protein QYF36_019066 [Acer negundo]|nr:hypothetical protein QYF36_019066 [Acer negundo]